MAPILAFFRRCRASDSIRSGTDSPDAERAARPIVPLERMDEASTPAAQRQIAHHLPHAAPGRDSLPLHRRCRRLKARIEHFLHGGGGGAGRAVPRRMFDQPHEFAAAPRLWVIARSCSSLLVRDRRLVKRHSISSADRVAPSSTGVFCGLISVIKALCVLGEVGMNSSERGWRDATADFVNRDVRGLAGCLPPADLTTALTIPAPQSDADPTASARHDLYEVCGAVLLVSWLIGRYLAMLRCCATQPPYCGGRSPDRPCYPSSGNRVLSLVALGAFLVCSIGLWQISPLSGNPRLAC